MKQPLTDAKKDEFVQRILDIANKTYQGEPIKQGLTTTYIIEQKHNETTVKELKYYLSEPHIQTYEKIRKDFLNLQRDYWSHKFTDSTILHIIDELMPLAVFNNNRELVKKRLDCLVSHLDNWNPKVTVLVPIDGIVFESKPFNIGRITLLTMKDVNLNTILDPHDTDSERVFAKVEIIAEPSRAIERAEEETRRVIDLLRYFCSNKTKTILGIRGEIPLAVKRTPIIDSQGLAYLEENKEIVRFTDYFISSIKDKGILDLAEVLKKDYQTMSDFERTLFQGIHWYSCSQAQSDSVDELLNLIICLETFFTRDGQPLSNTIAEGVAIIISNDLSERKSIKKRLKDFYNKRSKVSHGGHKAVSDSDVTELRALTLELIDIMIKLRTQFHSRKQLLEWIEDQKFG